MSDRPAPAHRVRLVPQSVVRDWPLWPAVFAGRERDHRDHELVADTLGFDCRVLVVEDAAGTALALQPCFFVEQDVVATAPRFIRHFAAALRRLFPRALRLQMLMIGCATGESDLTAPDHVTEIVAALPRLAREQGASLIVWKDMPVRHRAALEPVRARFPRIDGMPLTMLPLGYIDFEDYLASHLSHAMRKNLRRKFRRLETAPPIEFTATTRISDVLEEAHALYLQVFDRARLQFEKLTPEFLLGLEQRLGERARFFLWRQEGRLIAVSICMLHEGVLRDEYLGLDYRVALDLHLYYVTFRDVLSWAITEGLLSYVSTPLNYEPKLHLGFALEPLDLYVGPAAEWARPFLHLALPYIGPTRAEPILPRFAERGPLRKPQ